MYALHRPLIPKYTRAKLPSTATTAAAAVAATDTAYSSTGSRSSSGVSSHRSHPLFGHQRPSNSQANDSVQCQPSASGSDAPSTVMTRLSSASSVQQQGAPYSTEERRPSMVSLRPVAAKGKRDQQTIREKSNTGMSGKSAEASSLVNNKGGRQWSADSGIDEASTSPSSPAGENAKFHLPPRITCYQE
jgi:hypothetical protein